MTLPKKKISFRIDPEKNFIVSKISRDQNISESETLRRLLEIGIQFIDYDRLVGQYECLQNNFENLRNDVAVLSQKMNATNLNVVRINFFLEELAKVLIPEKDTVAKLKMTVKALGE